MAIGDVLRGLGSVLNPQVAQEAAQEDRAKQGQEQQIGMLLLQKRIQEQSPQYQAQVEALNNEKGFRQAAAQAGGDPVKLASAAVQFGKPELAVNLYNQQEARAARIQQAQQSFDLKEKELTQRSEDKAADRASRDQAQAQLFELKKQGLALQGELAKSNQELKRMQFTMNADKDLVKNTQKLQVSLEKANLPEADANLSAVEEILKKDPSIAEYISGPKRAIPDVALSSEITGARQAFDKLFNSTLKLRSGAAVTQQELDRLKSEFGVGITKKPEQVAKAVEQARGIITKHYRAVASGHGPEALKAYNENLRGLGGKPVLEPSEDMPKVVDFGSLQ